MSSIPQDRLSDRLEKNRRLVTVSDAWRTWFYQPRQTYLRRVLVQVHLSCALVAGLFVSMMGLTGTAIVYKDALDTKLNPRLLNASGPLRFSPDAMLRTAQTCHPGWRVLLLDTGTQPAWAFYFSRAGWDPLSGVDVVFVDPGTGEFLGHRPANGGVMNWLMNLHINLLSGSTGNRLVGVFACIIFLIAITGLLIWWPGHSRWRSRLKINVHAHWPRLNWDLHNVVGFFVGLPLALQALTAVSLVFPALVIPVFVGMFPGHPEEIKRFQDEGQSRLSHVAGDAADLGKIIAESYHRYPAMRLESIIFPLSKTDTYRVTLGSNHYDDRGSQARLIFDQYTGAPLSDIDTEYGSFGLRAFVALAPWHFGHIAGAVSRLLWMCLGLCPSILFTTGFLMWWRRVLAPRMRRRESEERSISLH